MEKQLYFKDIEVGDRFIFNHMEWEKVKSPNKWPRSGPPPRKLVDRYYNARTAEGWKAYIGQHRLVKKIKNV